MPIGPRQYINDSTYLKKDQDKYANIIQKTIRMWINRKKFERMLKYYYYLKQLRCNEEKNLKNVIYAEQQRTMVNLQYPTKTKDFEGLYSAINNHYKNIKKNRKNKTLKEVILENKIHLEEKLKCLNEIIKRRNKLKEIADEKKIIRQLNEISKPILMTRKNGKTISIETPETYQAQMFKEFYIALKRNDLSKDERVKLILKLKETLECFEEVDLTNPIIDLLNRELIMLNIVQLNNNQLKILRKRIEISFQFILKQPEINPAIIRTSKPLNLFKCYNCRKLKSLNKFMVQLDLKNTTNCKDCKHLYRITVEQINLSPHEDILKNIRMSEAQLCTKSSLAFFLSAEDIYYLVTIIWKGKSAISESKDIIQLRLVRWCNEKDWSPSNTILLTIEEAYIHSKIRNLNQNYTPTFIEGVGLKHMIAKNYFKGLTEKTMECDRNVEILKHSLNNN